MNSFAFLLEWLGGAYLASFVAFIASLTLGKVNDAGRLFVAILAAIVAFLIWFFGFPSALYWLDQP